jgi:hypothetical protein
MHPLLRWPSNCASLLPIRTDQRVAPLPPLLTHATSARVGQCFLPINIKCAINDCTNSHKRARPRFPSPQNTKTPAQKPKCRAVRDRCHRHLVSHRPPHRTSGATSSAPAAAISLLIASTVSSRGRPSAPVLAESVPTKKKEGGGWGGHLPNRRRHHMGGSNGFEPLCSGGYTSLKK